MIRYERRLTDDAGVLRWPDGVSLGTADPEALHELMHLAYGNTDDTPDDWWQRISADSEFDLALVIVAVTEGQPVGMAHCWTSSFIRDFVVHPEWQNRGVGSALLLEAFARLRARGHEVVALKTDDENHGAQRLYERMGFQRVPMR